MGFNLAFKGLISSKNVTSCCILQRSTAPYCILLHPTKTKETKYESQTSMKSHILWKNIT